GELGKIALDVSDFGLQLEEPRARTDQREFSHPVLLFLHSSSNASSNGAGPAVQKATGLHVAVLTIRAVQRFGKVPRQGYSRSDEVVPTIAATTRLTACAGFTMVRTAFHVPGTSEPGVAPTSPYCAEVCQAALTFTSTPGHVATARVTDGCPDRNRGRHGSYTRSGRFPGGCGDSARRAGVRATACRSVRVVPGRAGDGGEGGVREQL